MGAIYTTILQDVRDELGITNNEYVLLDTIQKLSARDGVCKAGAVYLAERVGISERGMRKMMVRMFELGLVSGKKGCFRVTKKWIHKAIISEQSSPLETELSSKKAELSSEKKELSSKKAELSSLTTDTIIKDNKTNNSELDLQLQSLNKMLGRPGDIIINKTRRSHLTARLKNFTFTQLCQAAKAIASNDFMIQGGHNTIDYLIRNDEKVEQWLAKAQAKRLESPF